jgi:hypothetical protein
MDVRKQPKIFDKYFWYIKHGLVFLTILYIILIASSTETKIDFMKLLHELPEDIGTKIYVMWRDIRDYSFDDDEAAQCMLYQTQNDNDREYDGWWYACQSEK